MAGRTGGRARRGEPDAGPLVPPALGSPDQLGSPDRRAQGRRSGLSDARSYTPRGRSIRESARSRTADPFRPALEVVSAGRTTPRRPAAATDKPTTGKRATGKRATGKRTTDKPTTGKRQTTAARPPRAKASAKTTATAKTRAQGRARAKASARTTAAPRLGEPMRRLRVATLVVFALFSVIALRLVQLQVTDARAYAAEGLEDRLTRIQLSAPRGAIYDRNGAVLAHSVEARYVFADPGLIDDPADAAAKLSPVLGIAPSELLPKLSPHKLADGRTARFAYLARGVSIDVGDAVRGLQIKGVGVVRDERREVPGHDLAANVLGFVGDDLHGLAGLESRYDEQLFGVNGERTFETGRGDLAKEIPGGYRLEVPPQPGSSLTLTLDRDLQYVVQQILSQRLRTAQAAVGCAIVLDIRTGEVLAQASYPAYDAADPGNSPPEHRVDAATGLVVDPGSVHKAIVVGAALQEGVVTPDSTVELAPTIRMGDQTYRDTTPLPAGTRQTLPGVLAFSSNVGTIKIAEALGPEKLYDYQRRFGLGTPTGVGVPGEAAGLVQPPKNWSGSSRGSIPIGHGVAVTPVQMAAAYAAIANDGLWVQPHLVRETIAPDGRRSASPEPLTRRVMDPQHAAALRQMLEAVVSVPHATGRAAALADYRVAGKTGTGARVVDGRYVPDQVASFVGMAPADAPRYVIAVFAQASGATGGAVAGPAFQEMMEYALRHYKVAPSGTKPPVFTVRR